LLGPLPGAAAQWKVYENCRLIPNEYNDGDSFHVKTKRYEYVFRVYFVDAPETDMSIPERVQQQAAYWDIDADAAVDLAEAAKKFTADFLRDGFTVYTMKEDAKGRGWSKRYFAMIKVGDRYLSEALVSAGLARIYGKPTPLPDGRGANKYIADLRVAEREARRKGVGGWRRGKPASAASLRPAVEEQELVLKRRAAVYSVDGRARLLGFLGQGATVRVMGAESSTMVRVRFKEGEEIREGLCRRSTLGL